LEKEFKQEVKPVFEVISFEAATSEDLTFINKQNIVVGNLEYELKFSHSRNQGYVVLNLYPYFRNKGGIQRNYKGWIVVSISEYWFKKGSHERFCSKFSFITRIGRLV
jgi:hypothetical protein